MSNDLSTVYPNIKPGIIAFACKYQAVTKPEDALPLPPIIGTGFVVNSDGLIATNDHVVDAFKNLPSPPNIPKHEWLVDAYIFHKVETGVIPIPLQVLGVFRISKFNPNAHYYGNEKPDIAFVRVKARGLPVLNLDDKSEIFEGTEVGTSGFPMGTLHMLGQGGRRIVQVSPTLQRGIISGVIPFPCKKPDGYVVNIMVQGGASGSPVFTSSNGKVIGILHSRRIEPENTPTKSWNPTNFSLVLPSNIITLGLNTIPMDSVSLPPDAKTIDELIATHTIVNVFTGDKDR